MTRHADRPAPEMQEPTRDRLLPAENHLIQVQSVFAAALAVATVFLSLYLFKVGGYSAIALFYAGQYACMPPAFIAAGYIMRKRSTRYVARAGLLVLCGEFLALLLLGPDAGSVPLLLGIVMGIGEGLYWPGINLSEYRATHTQTRHIYYGKVFFATNLASVIGLPLSGLVLGGSDGVSASRSDYYVLFAILVLLLLWTFRLGAGLAPWSEITFSVRDMRHHVRSPLWKLVLLQNFLRGIWAYALPAFAAVLLYLIVDGELALGLVTSGVTLVTAAASFAAGRLLQRYPHSFLLGAAIVPVGLISFGLQQNWVGVACYAFLVWGFDPFAQNFTYKAMYDVMERESARWQDAYHFIVEREIAWNAGRVTSFLGVLLVLQATDQTQALTTAIAVVAVLPVVVGFVQFRLYRLSV